MTLSLTPELTAQIEQMVRSGRFTSPEEVISAAVMAIADEQSFGDFKPGELAKLIAEGEASASRGGNQSMDAVFARLFARYRMPAESAK